ncbi:GNAT family N-acetyltransferase [Pseudalkalibacillus caeni]|uniref:GNAT family N-acetyltransferase n=1 Tax=Exobacillus caeni TaxID=2574798 RepID=A0A5R9FAQ8_9BACL|nr:GNAT family N-acetyltransferase [Pseudalkalibacillus caeni]TLS38748.1 GNAT family N-acetyltransferase [Pseudalkalibacillus caeni]
MDTSLTKEEILSHIEAHHWDHEAELIPPYIDFVNNEKVIMIKNPYSSSINANKVVKFDAEQRTDQEIDHVLAFFGESPFSWWVGPSSKPADLVERLEKKGFKMIDRYIGLAYPIDRWIEKHRDSPFEFKEALSEKDVQHHVNVSAEVWGYDSASAKTAFEQRCEYIEAPFRRGGFMVALDNGKGIAHSNYRYSEDGTVLYLNGSAVLPSYRNKGIYSQLVFQRLNEAKVRGCKLVTCQAREGTSEPILRKIGFNEYGVYIQMARV